MISAPHVVARFANAVPAQRTAAPWAELVIVVDATWGEANALAALTPLRTLVSFDTSAPPGDPCFSPKWRPSHPSFAEHAVDLLLPVRQGGQIRFEVGGPPSGSMLAGARGEIGRAIACPWNFDVGQCFEEIKQ